jgi:uncharacterized membrane protein
VSAAKRQHWILRLTAVQRLTAMLVAGAVAALIQPPDWSLGLRALVSWDCTALTYLALAGTTIRVATSASTRSHARAQDLAAYVIFVVVLSAAFASVAAIAILLGGVKELPVHEKWTHIVVSAFALLSSWMMIHTLFAFHYARRFYASREDPDAEPRGLNFPGQSDPDYFDFAYYSFVVGMTSQVSDVTINAHYMRRLTLIHGVLSFIFNIGIFAFSLNIIGSII